MPAIIAALFSLVTTLLTLGIPKVTEVVGIWFDRWRDRIKNEAPEVEVHIEQLVASHASAAVTEQLNRLRERAKG